MRTKLKLSRSFLIAASLTLTALGSTMAVRPLVAAEAPAVEDFTAAASQQMDSLIKTGQAIIANLASSTADKTNLLGKMILDNFDINAVGRFLLGPNWRAATEAEKAELITLIQTITVNAYSARLNDYALYKFVNRGAQMDGKSVLVFYEVIRPNNPTPINLQWRMIKSADGPKVVDAIVEGISLGVTQQQDFSSIIASKGKGVQGLLEELRA
ncbi:MAG: ABC transporter substrate-binding protein, partial [Candidatus Pacebacteria bacterium]|nr:ABC transporter substrate-binding protein [Candidatus Paceibacterota bacterium]